ncbi:hypothetical protein BLA29_001571 [Euroglyphus maynei]|uniref:Uncharacterized protein n=1 Tax=Euroglyphus maynei TaxID=6958 RepID=A0A1Y3B2Z7_EURMA|nr:hypothetical protein BLA29_001571 [Euroglyphus maynei]
MPRNDSTSMESNLIESIIDVYDEYDNDDPSKNKWNCQMMINESDSNIILFQIRLQSTANSLDLLIPLSSIHDERSKDLIETKLYFKPNKHYWRRELDWNNFITIGLWEDPTLLILYDHLFRKIVSIRFMMPEDVNDFRRRINRDRFTLVPWDEWEICQRVGVHQWNHFKHTFHQARYQWPQYVVNMAYVMRGNSSPYDDPDIEEDHKRKDRIIVEFVIRIHKQYKALQSGQIKKTVIL